MSDILDPVVGNYQGGREIISTEDLLARVEILNDKHSGWTIYSHWKGMIEGEYHACEDCVGEITYVWDEDSPELCQCGTSDGIDEEGRVLVTQGCMMKMRRHNWEMRVGWCTQDLDRKFTSEEVLSEDIQDYTSPMVVLGSDVVNLYPSLDITKVVKGVRDAVLDTKIKWGELDYLEAARYVALNWPEDKCRKSELGRILPKRRYTGGTRPGLTGVGPRGAERGDQEQWVFPHVRLTRREKRLLVATVLEIATQAMFTHHYYGFG